MQPPTSSSASARGKKLMRSATRSIISRPRLSRRLCVRCESEIMSYKRLLAAQQEGAAVAAEEARIAYKTNVKQVQAASNVKYKSWLKQMQEERDASSDKVTGLGANITELQRMINRANDAARAANKENAAAVSELEA
eukprot:1043425-Pleurochrysis_carterae.AAC.2